MESLAHNVYPTEWSGFPGESVARQQARADLRMVDESYDHVLPADALAINEVLKAEQADAFKEADKSRVYDYEIEMQRPVPPIKKVAERVSWRQRAKRFMSKASETVREASISAIATAQAKVEQTRNYYSDEEAGTTRKKVTGVVIGALALGATVYLSSKGVASSGSSHRHLLDNFRMFDITTLSHAPATEAHHHAQHIVTVHNGENPWTISQHHLQEQGNAHPNATQITRYDQRLAHANPAVYTYGDASAEHIPPGTELIMP